MENWTRWVTVITQMPDNRVILSKTVYDTYNSSSSWAVSFTSFLKNGDNPLLETNKILSSVFKVDANTYKDEDVEIKQLKPAVLEHAQTKINIFSAKFKKFTSLKVPKNTLIVAKTIEEIKLLMANKNLLSYVSRIVVRDLISRGELN